MIALASVASGSTGAPATLAAQPPDAENAADDPDAAPADTPPDEPPPSAAARLSWTRFPGADSCPDQEALAADVRDRVGYDPFARPDPRTFVEGRVRPSADGYTASLSFRDAEGALIGERALATRDDDRCRALAEASALAVALVLDPIATLGGAPPRVPEEDDPPGQGTPAETRRMTDTERPWSPADTPSGVGEPTAPGEDTRADAAETAPEEGGPSLEAQLRLEANGGALPGGVALGPGLQVVVRSRLLAVGVGAVYYPQASEGLFAVGLAAANLDLCAAPSLADGVLADLCLRGVLGARRQTVNTDEVVGVDEGESAWGAIGAVGRLRGMVVGPLFLTAEIGFLVAIRVREVRLCAARSAEECASGGGETQVLWDEPRVSLTGAVGAGLVF